MIRLFLLSIVVMSMTACTPGLSEPKIPKVKDVALSVKGDEVSVIKKYDDSTKTKEIISKSSEKKETTERVPSFTNKQIINSAQKDKKQKTKQILISGKNKVQISVESIPLNEFIDVVFGQVLKQNYTMTEETRKITLPITLNMSTKEPKQQVFNVVRKLLQMNGVALEKDNGTLFFSKKQGTSTVTDDGMFIGYGKRLPKSLNSEEKIGMFIPIAYTSMGDIQSLLRTMGSKRMQFTKIQDNLFFTVSETENIRKLLEIIDMLDRPSMVNKKTILLSLEYMDVEKFTRQMRKIFKVNGIKTALDITQQGVILDPIEEIQSVLVISSESSTIDMLMYWKEKLDLPQELGEDPRLYIYKVKHRRADELSEAINNMLGLATTNKTKKIVRTSNIAGEKKPTQKEVTATSGTGTLLNVDYRASVSADLATNMLMLKLKPKHYKVLIPIIEQLDVLPLQTLVEVTIAEVDMTDTFSLGFEWAVTNRGVSIDDVLTVTGGGKGLGAVFKGDKLNATLNAFAEDKLLDIVSKPKILILNNETGNINVGTQVPIITSETSASDIPNNSVNRNISYRTTGVTMGVSPTINSEGVLTMKIDISLSEAQLNDTSDIDSPLIVDRKLSTVAVVKSTNTIMIGGLISTNTSKSDGGVPYLKDIPWLGSFFKAESSKTVKTELIILIRPTIIRSPLDIDAQTRKFKATLEHLKYF